MQGLQSQSNFQISSELKQEGSTLVARINSQQCYVWYSQQRKEKKEKSADGDPQHEIANVRALEHLHPHSGKLHLYIKISWCLMLTLRIHKLQKSCFKQ
jgi:hypothetical protein